MDTKLFDELVQSMNELGEIMRGERAPSREFELKPRLDAPQPSRED